MALKSLSQSPSYLKAGFQGFQKSGKTYTATELAIGVRTLFKLKGPIGFFDTESGSDYVNYRVREATGLDLVGDKSRSLRDLLTLGEDCLKEGVSVLVVDSVTHIWRELCDSYLRQINDRKRYWAERDGKKFYPKDKLEFQDIAVVKNYWEKWTTFYLNAPLHIIICGRAGYTWDFETDEDTGKKQLVKTGVKMKTETEFGFEPSLLVEMERIEDTLDRKKEARRQATVIGDRFGVIDGKTALDPTWEFFRPHLERLNPSNHRPIENKSETEFEIGAGGHSEAKRRTILAEEIQGLLLEMHPGQATAEKLAKAKILEDVFGTRSWTAIENLSSEQLKEGLAKIREMREVQDVGARAFEVALPSRPAP